MSKSTPLSIGFLVRDRRPVAMLQISGLTLGEDVDVKPLFEDRLVVVAAKEGWAPEINSG